MDVYFERIAGVAERKPAGSKPKLVTKRDPDRDPEDEDEERPVGLDENGFPLSPLREQDHLWFVQAAGLYGPMARCASTARASGSMLILTGAVAAVIGGLAFHVVTVVIALILITLGSIERSGATDMARVKRSAPSRLAWNQLILFGLVTLYCATQMKSFHTAYAKTQFITDPVVSRFGELPPELAQFLARMETVLPDYIYAFYGFIIAMSFVFQGMMALYYVTRRSRVRLFYQELPPWVADIVKSIAAR